MSRRQQSLDGPWEMWASAVGSPAELDAAAWMPATVPGHWTRAGLPDHDGQVWYWHHIKVEDPTVGGTPYLVFGGVDYATAVWLNGHALGEHVGYFEPFAFPVAAHLVAGSNTLWVRVNAPREVPGSVWPHRKRLLKGALGHHATRPGGGDPLRGQDGNTGGIWGHVALEWRPTPHVADLEVRTHVAAARATAIVTARVQGPPGTPVTATLHDPEGQVVATAAGAVDEAGQAIIGLAVDRPRLWWCWDQGEQPLYTLSVQAGEDVVEQMIGLRQLSREADGWRINGRRIFVRGTQIIPAQYLGEYLDEACHADVELVRAAGLNAVRVLAHVTQSAFYDACDRAGVLVWQDLPLHGSCDASPAFVAEAGRQMGAMVRLLRHHPAIAAWGCHDDRPPGAEALDGLLAQAALREDGARPVYLGDDMLGMPRVGAPALPSLDTLLEILPAEALWPPDWTRWAWHGFDFAATVARDGQVPGDDLGDFVRRTQHHQAEVLLDVVDRVRRARYAPFPGLMQEHFVDGWPALSASVLDYKRRPKLGFHTLQAAMAPVYLSMRLPAARHVAGHPLPLDMVLINDLGRAFDDLELNLAMLGAEGQVLRSWGPLRVSVGPDTAQDLSPVFGGPLYTEVGWLGGCLLEATCSLGGATVSTAVRPIDFVPLPTALGGPALPAAHARSAP